MSYYSFDLAYNEWLSVLVDVASDLLDRRANPSEAARRIAIATRRFESDLDQVIAQLEPSDLAAFEQTLAAFADIRGGRQLSAKLDALLSLTAEEVS